MHWDCDPNWFSNVHVDFARDRISCERNTSADSGKIISAAGKLHLLKVRCLCWFFGKPSQHRLVLLASTVVSEWRVKVLSLLYMGLSNLVQY